MFLLSYVTNYSKKKNHSDTYVNVFPRHPNSAEQEDLRLASHFSTQRLTNKCRQKDQSYNLT